MAKLTQGDQAPDFKLSDQEGKQVQLADFRGRKILVYFYPKADTPGCTVQACSIRDAGGELRDLGVVPLGISPDAPDAQKKFDHKYTLGFELLSDPGHTVAEAYGAFIEKANGGKKGRGILRSSFLIDERGAIIDAWYGVKPEDTVPRAREALQGDST